MDEPCRWTRPLRWTSTPWPSGRINPLIRTRAAHCEHSAATIRQARPGGSAAGAHLGEGAVQLSIGEWPPLDAHLVGSRDDPAVSGSALWLWRELNLHSNQSPLCSHRSAGVGEDGSGRRGADAADARRR
jgi:hypothetical protein